MPDFKGEGGRGEREPSRENERVSIGRFLMDRANTFGGRHTNSQDALRNKVAFVSLSRDVAPQIERGGRDVELFRFMSFYCSHAYRKVYQLTEGIQYAEVPLSVLEEFDIAVRSCGQHIARLRIDRGLSKSQVFDDRVDDTVFALDFATEREFQLNILSLAQFLGTLSRTS